MKEERFDAIVIGGGPAGIMAAGRAAERGRGVLLLEKNDILARKLLISGKGRCNISNAGEVDEYFENFGGTGQFLRDAFSSFFNKELTDFFEKKRVPLKVERGKRIFPKSDRSKDILNALKNYLKETAVKVVLRSAVKKIAIGDKGKKRVVLSSDIEYKADSLVISTGGVSYPETGSTRFGLEEAKRLGHNVIAPAPALIPLVTESNIPKIWQGISLKNVEVAVIANGKKRLKRFGDVLFTHFGLSGPTILDISAEVHKLLRLKKDMYVSINLKPALGRDKLSNRLIREFSGRSNKILRNMLRGLLPHKMVDGFIKICEIDPEKKVNQITKEERSRLVEELTDLRFRIKATRPISEAIVTKGGVDTKEINPKTMESRLIKGLFFAGEVIDIDAKTGGYNMQAAFSTGYLCGENI